MEETKMKTLVAVLRRPFRTGLAMFDIAFLMAGAFVLTGHHATEAPALLVHLGDVLAYGGLGLMAVGGVAFLVRHDVVPTLWDFVFVNFLFSLLDQ
jgi:hypothetical protein